MNDMTIVCERYTPMTFNSWTDGPKYIFDTNDLSDKVNLERIVSVFTVKSESALKADLNGFVLESVGTFYFIDDERMAGVAKALRPDLDIGLLVL